MRIRIVENIEGHAKEENRYIKEVIERKISLDGKRAEKTIVITPEVFSKVFSPARLRLLLRIKENNIANIYQLAKSLRRPYESVHRDIQYLAGFKLIKIKTKGKKRIPYTDEPIKIPQFVNA
ncbi:hypothetical protein J4457_04260 [Candidatus Woesearchaeota archaeon]|nr:hypothetical protein [Candidatus Woesearchaeota archaeon]